MKKQRYLPVRSVQSSFHLGLRDYPCLKNLSLELFETSRLPNCLGADQTGDSRMGGGDPGNHVTRLIDICVFAVASRDRALHGEWHNKELFSPYFSFRCRFKPKPITPPFHQRPVMRLKLQRSLFVNKYLLPSAADIIIHDAAQMAVVSKQMRNAVILTGTLQLITQSD